MTQGTLFEVLDDRDAGAGPADPPPELAGIVASWPALPVPIKVGIVAMVQAAQTAGALGAAAADH